MSSVSTDRRRGINGTAAIKIPCIAGSTANLALEGEQTIDGIALITNDRVLVKDQTDSTENGVYRVDTSSWQREPDFDGRYDVVEGTIVPISRGTANATTYWRVDNTGTITIGTTALTFSVTSVLQSAVLQDGTVKMIADFSPQVDDTYDLGTTLLRWVNGFFSGVLNAVTLTISGLSTFTGTVKFSKGTDLTDTDIDGANILTVGADGNSFDITGSQQIDAIATVGVGTDIRLIHLSARQLTNHATNLILPGGANITTASGDISEWFEYAVGDWRCTNYQVASNPILNTKRIDIGDWNMDASSSTTVAHGLTWANIRTVVAYIRPDSGAGTVLSAIESSNASGTANGTVRAGLTTVDLTRVTGGDWDNASFDSTSYNRGWITIQYTD